MSLSILVHEHIPGEEVPGVEVPGATEPNDRDLELISQTDDVLVALLGQPRPIGKHGLQLNKDLGYGAIHQVGHILIGTHDIFAIRVLGELLVIRVQEDPFGALVTGRVPEVPTRQNQDSVVDVDILVEVLVDELGLGGLVDWGDRGEGFCEVLL